LYNYITEDDAWDKAWLMPLSSIFNLHVYYRSQFCFWRKPEYPRDKSPL